MGNEQRDERDEMYMEIEEARQAPMYENSAILRPEKYHADASIGQGKTIAVLTSGGDAPGMNASIRAVVRAGLNYGYNMLGVRRGYHGLWRGDFVALNSRSVSEKLQKGGTFLMTARSTTFRTPEGLRQAAEMCRVFNVDAVVVIGGDGSFQGAKTLTTQGIKVIGIPGTIDNDIACTEYTIGYDTAMNTAMEAIDKLRDTASSHERCSVIEVMGRHAGYLALNVGLSCGAEVILTPEVPMDFEKDVVRTLLECRNRGKSHYVVVVAEGFHCEGMNSAIEMASKIEALTGIETRATILGHLQRGGSPTIRDRQMASLMGLQAVHCINEGRYDRLVCMQNGKITDVDIHEGLAMKKGIDRDEVMNALLIAM